MGDYRAIGLAMLSATILPIPLQAQETVPEWRIEDEPRLEVGSGEQVLYRVTDAAMLPNGGLVVADAGNHRVLQISSNGRIVGSVGREGAGPGEFRWIARIDAFHDTILAYDTGLSRVSWIAGDSVLKTVRLPHFNNHETWLAAIESPDALIVHTAEGPRGAGPTRLYTNQTSFLLFHPSTDELSLLDRRPLTYRYLFAQQNGYTVYGTPFFGSAQIVGLPRGYAFVPLDSAVVGVRMREQEERIVRLPVPLRDFEPELIENYRDSLMAAARRSGFGSSARRIQRVYDEVPTPELAPTVRRMIRVGEHIWVEVFPMPDDRAARWYVIHPEIGSVVAFIDLPHEVTLLGGDARSVVLLTRTPFDEEVVQVLDLERQ